MMSPLQLSTLAEQIDGQLFGDAQCAEVCTDSRQLKPGDLFVALRGEHFDGHRFLASVLESGASAAIVAEKSKVALPQLQVKDTRLVLGLIARSNRRQFSGPLIGLTGSAGKTTTKEMLASILSQCGAVLATAGNFNNEIGVPLTLLRLEPDHQFAVIEMGASKAGDIRYLTQFAEPTIAVLTNAMPVHLEGFGDIDGIANTKGEIFASLSQAHTAVINADDSYAEQWRRAASGCQIQSFSLQRGGGDVYAVDIQTLADSSSRFVLVTPIGEVIIELALLGRHNIANALAAATAALAAGATLADIAQGLAAVRPVSGRLHSVQLGNIKLIDDSYNASPSSVKAAIDVLRGFAGKRYLVLGTMGELGVAAEEFHLDVARYAREQGIDNLWVVGEYGAAMAREFGQRGRSFLQMDDLLESLDGLNECAAVLVKGSRSAKMERVANALKTANTNGRKH